MGFGYNQNQFVPQPVVPAYVTCSPYAASTGSCFG